MINKETAGLLYSYNYKIVDKDGNVWDIEGIAKRGKSFRIDIYCNEKLNSWHAKPEDIGVKYWILARELDLTKEITVDGVTFVPIVSLCKMAFPDYYEGVDFDENDISELEKMLINLVSANDTLTVDLFKKLNEWQYSHDLPAGSWKPIKD